ncbi:hypothetical protein AC1031_007934 [Aphanomyces cochlioides]|nr:hypothetical protein AC1031_007934 [Aphanomyces cochlioides]
MLNLVKRVQSIEPAPQSLPLASAKVAPQSIVMWQAVNGGQNRFIHLDYDSWKIWILKSGTYFVQLDGTGVGNVSMVVNGNKLVSSYEFQNKVLLSCSVLVNSGSTVWVEVGRALTSEPGVLNLLISGE